MAEAFPTSHPREHAAPVSSLLSQGRCDIADSRALLRQNDVLHAARQSTGNMGPKTKTPRPEGIKLSEKGKAHSAMGVVASIPEAFCKAFVAHVLLCGPFAFFTELRA